MQGVVMFIEFQVSWRPHKKYAAVMHYRDGTTRTVHFGDTRYQHFRDRTPLRAFAHLDHTDPARRANYKARHGSTRHVRYSPSWFADKYLW